MLVPMNTLMHNSVIDGAQVPQEKHVGINNNGFSLDFRFF